MTSCIIQQERGVRPPETPTSGSGVPHTITSIYPLGKLKIQRGLVSNC